MADHGSPIFTKLCNARQTAKRAPITDRIYNEAAEQLLAIFTQFEAAQLIKRTIKWTEQHGGGFVKSYKMKCVNMFDLAKVVAGDNSIEIVGRRPGEKKRG